MAQRRGAGSGYDYQTLTMTSPRVVRRWGRWLALGVLLSVISDFSVLRGGPWTIAAVLAISVVILMIIAGPERWVLPSWLVLLLPVRDIHSSAEEAFKVGWGFWPDGYGPVGSGPLILALLIWSWIRCRPSRVNRWDLAWWAYFGLIVPATTLAFSEHGIETGAVVTDARFAVLLGVAVPFATRHFAREGAERTRRILQIALLMLIARHLVDFGYFVGGVEMTRLGSVSRVSVDSAKGLVVVLVSASVVGAITSKRIIGYTGGVLASTLLLVYQTRFLVITLVFSLGALAACLPWRRWGIGAISIITVGAIVFSGSQMLFPDQMRVAQGRWEMLASDLGAGGIQSFDDVRWNQILNSQAALWSRGAVLSGLGYGAHYDQSFRQFRVLDASAFTVEQISAGRFYRIHEVVFHIWFKFGLIGLLLYASLFLRPGVRLFHRARRLRFEGIPETTLLIVLAALPVIGLNLFWTGKGLVITGLYIGALRQLAVPTDLEDGAAAISPSRLWAVFDEVPGNPGTR